MVRSDKNAAIRSAQQTVDRLSTDLDIYIHTAESLLDYSETGMRTTQALEKVIDEKCEGINGLKAKFKK